MALLFDTGSAPQTADELRLLAEAIRRADSVDESDWLEWKSTLDLSDKEQQFELARYILGFANRLPDSASHNCEGFGYLFVGIEPNSVNGIVKLDPAKLDDAINAYTGSDGPIWKHSYLPIDGTDVLVIVVYPPKSGDPAHTLRKTYKNNRPGDIFVRKQGKTERADPGDISNLLERYRTSRLNLTIQLTSSEPIPWFDQAHVDHSIQHIARQKRSSMLRKARNKSAGSGSHRFASTQSFTAISSLFRPDDRTIEQYEKQVNDWYDEWIEQAREMWLLKYLNCDYGLAWLTLTNTTDRNFSSVEVQLEIVGATVFADLEKPDTDLPPPPRDFGKPTSVLSDSFGYHSQVSDISRLMPHFSEPEFDVEHFDGGSSVVWDAGDIRPRGIVQSGSLHIIINSSSHRDNLSCRWAATTTSADGVNEGQLHISTQDSPVAFDDIEHGIEFNSP